MKKRYKISAFIIAIVFSVNFVIYKPLKANAVIVLDDVLVGAACVLAAGLGAQTVYVISQNSEQILADFERAGGNIANAYTWVSDGVVNISNEFWDFITGNVNSNYGSVAGQMGVSMYTPITDSFDSSIGTDYLGYKPYFRLLGILATTNVSVDINNNGQLIAGSTFPAGSTVYYAFSQNTVHPDEWDYFYYIDGVLINTLTVVKTRSHYLYVSNQGQLCALGAGSISAYRLLSGKNVFAYPTAPLVDVYPEAGVADYDIVNENGERLISVPSTIDELAGMTPSDVLVQNPVIPQPTADPVVPPWTGESSWPDWLTGAGSIISGIGANIGSIAGTIADVFTIPKEADIDIELPKLTLPELVSTKFPFSIPWDLYSVFSLFLAPAQVPKFTVTFPIMKWTFSFDIDFQMMEPVAKLTRWFTLVMFNLWLIGATRKLIGAGG